MTKRKNSLKVTNDYIKDEIPIIEDDWVKTGFPSFVASILQNVDGLKSIAVRSAWGGNCDVFLVGYKNIRLGKNARLPICRYYFCDGKEHSGEVGVFDPKGNETWYTIESVIMFSDDCDKKLREAILSTTKAMCDLLDKRNDEQHTVSIAASSEVEKSGNKSRRRITMRNKIKGGLLGLLIGDALGVPYEFKKPEQIPPLKRISFKPPKGYPRSHAGVPAGTWSDDGAQALCLLQSLLHRDRFDLSDFALRLLNWEGAGFLAVDGHVFDIGNATRTALRHRLGRGMKPELSGLTDESSNGNGSLMRVLPLALWHTGTDEELVANAQRQSLVTHGHIRSQVCCAMYCLYARRILEGEKEPWQSALESLRSLYTDKSALAELNGIIQYDAKGPTGSGYVVDSLIAAKHAWSIPTYSEAVRWAISLGDDTDTTACIVGGIIGLRDGATSIPKRWMAQLRGRDIYIPLLEKLLHRRRQG